MEIAHQPSATADNPVQHSGRLPVVFPASMPFLPGRSPFWVKGSYYREIQERLVDWDGVMNIVDDAALREFGRQRFLASEWYDYLPMLGIARALGIYYGCSAERAITEQAVRNARRQLSGIYKFVLSFTSPEVGMRRMGNNVYRTLYHFGRCDITTSSNSAVARYHEWPLMMAWIYQHTTDAWVGTLLGIAGASGIRRSWSPPVPEGSREGVELVRLEVRTTWNR